MMVGSAFGTTFYLDIAAEGANNGESWTDAWETVDAFDPDNLAGGDIVLCRDGNYGDWAFERDAGEDTNFLTIQADTGEDAVILTSLRMNYGFGGANELAYVKFDGIDIIGDTIDTDAIFISGQSFIEFHNLTVSGVGQTTRTDAAERLIQLKWAVGPPIQKSTNITFNTCVFDGRTNGANWHTYYGFFPASGGADNITFIGCTFSNFYIALYQDGNNWLIDTCEIKDGTSDGILINTGDGVIIRDSTIHDIDKGGESQHSDLLQIQTNLGKDITNVTIERNICFNSSDQGFLLQPQGTCSNLIVQNNVLWGANFNNPGEVSFLVKLGIESGNAIFRNNTLLQVEDGADGKFRITNLTPQLVTGNIFFGIFDDPDPDSTNFTNNIFVDNITDTLNPVPESCLQLADLAAFKAMFTDYDGKDFTLAVGSEAIDFANPQFAPPTDILGVTRGDPPDAGAYDSGSSASGSPRCGGIRGRYSDGYRTIYRSRYN